MEELELEPEFDPEREIQTRFEALCLEKNIKINFENFLIFNGGAIFGIEKIILTPHQKLDCDDIHDKIRVAFEIFCLDRNLKSNKEKLSIFIYGADYCIKKMWSI